MFKNYILIAIRNILGQKFYSVLNILGLAIGIAGFILIAIWVREELSYDRHFKNADRIYRIETSLVTHGVPSAMAATDPRIAQHVRNEYPEIENIVRIYKIPTLFTNNTQKAYEANTFYADSTFFEVFSFELISGDPHTVLMKPGSVVVTEDIATRLFGNENPIGKPVNINNARSGKDTTHYFISGVFRENKLPSHFHPKAIIAKFKRMETFELTYMLLKKGYDTSNFTGRIWNEIYQKHFIPDYRDDDQDVILNRVQPLTKIHLSGTKWEDIEKNDSMMLVYVFSAIGFLILLIACVNYINLATARSFSRSREVGVRKVLGASPRQLVTQFLVESIVLSSLALLLALSLVEIVLPFFNTLADKELTLQVQDPLNIISLLSLALFVGCISGIYPAFFISSFQPTKSLKGTLSVSKNKPTLRKVLVVFQFSLSIIMLIATMVIARQLEFVKKQDLGFDKNRILLVNLNDQKANINKEGLKSALLANPDILKVSTSYNIPGSEINHTFISFEMPTGMEAKLISSMYVDHDYINVMGLTLIKGRNFDSAMLSKLDSAAFIIINESAVKSLGWKDPVGKKIETGKFYGLRKGYCIGVVKDFHAKSLHDTIAPLVLALGRLGRPEGKLNFLSIKIKPDNLDKTIKYVEDTYKSFGQGSPFEYSFLDEEFNKQYIKEEKQKILFNWFAGLSIFISCLGLIGLASFFTKQRTKEICIRKIAGASVFDIVLLLSVDFIKLVLIALVIASPIAYYAMNKWLQNFAYHISIDFSFFVVAGISALFIVLATIGIQSLIAANKNPASVLKYE